MAVVAAHCLGDHDTFELARGRKRVLVAVVHDLLGVPGGPSRAVRQLLGQIGGGLVDIVVYDVNGREVRRLVHEQMGAGAGKAVWDGLDNSGENVASGVYFAKLDIDGLTASGKLIVLK